MAYSKTFVCLSMALRERGRGVIGRTMEGEWVRPVSGRPGGAFFPGECACEDGQRPRTLDVISIQFERPAGAECWRESHVVLGERWVKQGRIAFDEMVALADPPDRMWGSPRTSNGGSNDVVSCREARESDRSAMLIAPENLQIRVDVEGAVWPAKGVRASFRHGGEPYSLRVTDELALLAFMDKGLGRYPLDAYLCVSLTQPSRIDGLCRMVVTGVLAREPIAGPES